MNIKIIENKAKSILPRVGELWSFKNCRSSIHMRIKDEHGIRVFSDVLLKNKKYIFSVCVMSDTPEFIGNIGYSFVNSERDIIVLKEPVLAHIKKK